MNNTYLIYIKHRKEIERVRESEKERLKQNKKKKTMKMAHSILFMFNINLHTFFSAQGVSNETSSLRTQFMCVLFRCT